MGVLRALRNVAAAANDLLGVYGFYPRKTFRAFRGTPAFVRDLRTFRRMLRGRSDWALGKMLPMLAERFEQSGNASGHYFHQDLLVARRIHQRNPRRHVDVGSRIDGFVAHVASFREIEVADIRPLDAPIPNVRFLQMDLMKEPGPDHISICDSLSCLHVLEHIGLGRYGDCVDPDGYRTGFANLVKMLEPAGILYFSVPMGRQRIEFNAHRVFGLAHLLDIFKENGVQPTVFSYVKDDGSLVENAPITSEVMNVANDMHYGCGIFELRKSPAGDL